jgi:hypothetical protein
MAITTMTGRHWLASALGAAVATALGVVINVATDLKSNWLAWAAVVVLTFAGWAIGVGVAKARRRGQDFAETATGGQTSETLSETHQYSDGNTGASLQAGRDITIKGETSGRVILTLGCVVLVAVVIGLAAGGLLTGKSRSPGGSTSAGANDAAPVETATGTPSPRQPAIAVAKAWPYVSGCPSVGAVAMPPGMGSISDFHAPTDIRGRLTSSGAGSWTRGTLYLDLSAASDQTVEIINIQPHIDRRDLAPPAWIYVPDDGCGPYNSDRIFNFNLDAPTFTDKGLFVSDSGREPQADMPAAPLGPGFTVTSSQHARVRVNATSCHANYEWSLDVQYVAPGGSTIEHYNVGPFQSYGVANNTTVYTGNQGPTGSVHVDKETTLTGSDPTLSKTDPADPFFQC